MSKSSRSFDGIGVHSPCGAATTCGERGELLLARVDGDAGAQKVLETAVHVPSIDDPRLSNPDRVPAEPAVHLEVFGHVPANPQPLRPIDARLRLLRIMTHDGQLVSRAMLVDAGRTQR